MVRIVVVAAPPDLTSDSARFISKSNLVDGIHTFDGEAISGDFYTAGAERIVAGRPPGRRRGIPADAAKLLRIAWQTELAARVGELYDDDLLRLATLQTLPVQVYYAVFSAGRALTHVAGAARDGHEQLRATFAREHVRRAPGAFGVALTGDPDSPADCQLTPLICQPVAFNQLERHHEAAQYVWAALRWARRHGLERAREDWINKSGNRTKAGTKFKKLPSGVRAQLAASQRPTSMLDFLYELRVSTNYRTIDEYSGDLEPHHVARFHRGMLHLLDAGLLTYEGQVARYAGTAALQVAFDDWSRRTRPLGDWATEHGQARLDALGAAGL